MIDLIWFFLPMILFLGVVTSYTDIRFGKIKNIWIMLAFLYVFIVYSIILMYLWFFGIAIDDTFFFNMFLNLVIAAVIGIMFWLNTYWSAADAKLFIAFCALVPLSTYQFNYVAFFPSANLLLNSLILIFVVLGFQMIIQSRPRHYFKSIRDMFRPRTVLMLAVMIFIALWLNSLFLRFLGTKINTILILLFIVLLMPVIGKNLVKYKVVSIIIFSIILIFDYRYIFSTQLIKNFGLSGIIFILIIILFIQISSRAFIKTVHVNNLKKGMILDEEIVKSAESGRSYSKRKRVISSVDQTNAAQSLVNLVEITTEGLTNSDIKKIKVAYRAKRLEFEKIKVISHTYFAPYLFLATLFIVLTNGYNILFFIRQLI